EVPILQIIGEYDHLIPPETSKPFNEVVGSDDTEIIEYPTGHIGMSVSASTHRDVWPRVAEWFIEKSTDDPEHLEEVAEAVEASTEQIEIEEIDVEIDAEADEESTERDGAVEIEIEDDRDDGMDLRSAIDGIGPTYAERLSEAGIDTAEQLSSAAVSTVAEAAGVSEKRAEGWIEQAR
ncbi:MAG: helix-hairpin-helix domain-containing protein, partial [Natronomonas sp.]